jgi:putative mRNA 3-end processing factor
MRASDDIVVLRPEGLYCPAGDFHIDPWRPVERAVITHAHADHARAGHAHYLAAAPGATVLRARLPGMRLETLAYGEARALGPVRVSLHPAGHVLGSAQVRLERAGRVWVVSGDYKVAPGFVAEDTTCAPFEPLRCETFVTESTFGLPVYRWDDQAMIIAEIDAWWRDNAAAGRASLLYAYSLGKAQRLLAALDASIGPIACHGAVETLNAAYRAAGVALPDTRAAESLARVERGQTLVIAPPSVRGSAWEKRFGAASDAFASGWMLLRGARRRQGVDRGFALSDHADWPGLLAAIDATGAGRVIVTHGQADVLVRHLTGRGLQAGAFATEFGDEDGATAPTDQATATTSVDRATSTTPVDQATTTNPVDQATDAAPLAAAA